MNAGVACKLAADRADPEVSDEVVRFWIHEA